MTIMAAVGWAFGVTFGWIFLNSATLSIRPGSTYDLVTRFGCQAIAYLFGLFLILRVHAPEASIRDVVGLRGTHPLFYPLAILLGAAIEVPADGLYEVIIRRFPPGIEDKFPEVFRDSSTPQRAVYGLLIVLIGPLLEEVFFRGALFRLLSKRYAFDTVILTTAILFAVAHLEPQMFLPIGVVGMAMAFLRHASGSIVPSFLLHATFNGVSFLLTVRAAPGAAELGFSPRFVAAAFAAALLLVGMVHLVGARSAVAARARELDHR
jgi:hypothetical protein